MKYQTVIIICVTLFILILYWVIKNNFKKTSKSLKEKRYDLIIQFNSDSYIDIRKVDILNNLAQWSQYGKYGFRGFCILNKEDTEKFLVDNINIDKEKFKVIKANPGLYLPS